MKAVEIDDLVCEAGGRAMLTLPHLRIAEGERVAVVGHNGAGKSTLLRVLGGFLAPTRGRVRVLGREPGPALRGPELRRLRAEVGQVMQGLHLVPRLSTRENVLIGALARIPGWRSWLRVYPADAMAEADAALADLGLAGKEDTRTDRLSGGERQKVAIARMRMQRPKLILADEPTANLDPSAASDACRQLVEAAHGATLVTVVHQPALLPTLADRVLGLRSGQLLFDLPMNELTPQRLDELYELPATPPVAPARAPSPATARWMPTPHQAAR